VLLAIGGFFAEITPWPLLAVVFTVPGSVVLATSSGLPDIAWIRIFVAATAVIGGVLAADFDKRYRRQGLALPLFAISAVGIYYTVPDTEQALVLLAVALVMVVSAWPVPLASLGFSGAFASVGLLAWAVAEGGIGRHASVIGGIACLALLVAEPLSRVGRSRRGSSSIWGSTVWSTPAAGMVQLVFVAFGSRVVGLRASVTEAAGLAILELAVAMATIRAMAKRAPATR
jgi:hypothetical protein